MVEGRVLPLTQMQSGQSGVLAEISGGYGLVNRLDALGLRSGRRITKVSSMLMRGPITVQIDRTEVAIGFGIARKVMVRLE
jgi:ferrous iron transport protein A